MGHGLGSLSAFRRAHSANELNWITLPRVYTHLRVLKDAEHTHTHTNETQLIIVCLGKGAFRWVGPSNYVTESLVTDRKGGTARRLIRCQVPAVIMVKQNWFLLTLYIMRLTILTQVRIQLVTCSIVASSLWKVNFRYYSELSPIIIKSSILYDLYFVFLAAVNK